MVYDLLPLSHPHWFKLGFCLRFQRWARFVGREADHLICISRTTREVVTDWLPGWSGSSRMTIVPPHSGDSLRSSDPDPCTLPCALPDQFLLMVGTIEPRKGHAEVLAAFEILWTKGYSGGLVIAGAVGWDSRRLKQRIRDHPAFGSRLYWVERPADQILAGLYASCTGVLLASHAEGFGLPISEARAFRKPVLARQIPPFVEQRGDDMVFFASDASTEAMAAAIKDFVDRAVGLVIPKDTEQHPANEWSSGAKKIWEVLTQVTSPTRNAI